MFQIYAIIRKVQNRQYFSYCYHLVFFHLCKKSNVYFFIMGFVATFNLLTFNLDKVNYVSTLLHLHPMVCILVIDTTYCCICCTSIILLANFTLFICKFHLIIVRQKKKKKKKKLLNSFHISLINGKLLQIVSKKWR
jgi:hypothetical protein